MTITWMGHACFLLDSEEGRAVFDPYAPGAVPGLRLPPLTADAVLCSHEHSDHGWAQGVSLTHRRPGFRVQAIPSWHDDVQGAKRGYNLIYAVTCCGKRLVHLGDLGHALTQAQLEAIGTPDVLMIPVGGTYTIDADLAVQTCRQLSAKCILPMHYRGASYGLQDIAPLAPFTAQFDAVYPVQGSSLELSDAPNGVVVFSTPGGLTG